MEVVSDLLEGSGRLLIAILIEHVDLDIPLFHGELGHGRRLVAVRCRSQLPQAGQSVSWAGVSSGSMTMHYDKHKTYMFFCSVTSLTFRYNGASKSVTESARHRDARRREGWEVTYFDLHGAGVAVVVVGVTVVLGCLGSSLALFASGGSTRGFLDDVEGRGGGFPLACRASRRAIPGELIELASSLCAIASAGRHGARINRRSDWCCCLVSAGGGCNLSLGAWGA